MPLPADFNTVRVYGTYTNLDGTAATGTVTFTPVPSTTLLRSAANRIAILPSPITATLNVSGTFDIQLPATNDPDVLPTFSYTVTEKFTPNWSRTYTILVPLGSEIDLTEAVPADPVTAMASYVRSVNGVLPDASGNAIVAQGGTRWVAFGDSLSSQQANGAPYNGWVDQVQQRADGAVFLAGNAGVSGNSTAQMLARIDTDVMVYSPMFVTVLGGTNDVTGATTVETTIANLTAIVSALQARGVTVCMATVPPRFDTTKIAKTVQLNAWIRAYAAKHGCHLLDIYGATVDASTGKYAAGFAVSDADNLHMTRAGHAAVADLFLAKILPKLPAGQVTRPYTNADTANIVTNGLLVTQSGGVPTGWVRSGTTTGLTEALVTDSDFRGSAWEVALVTPSSFRQFSWNLAGGTWAIGDRLLFVARFKITVSSGVSTTAGFRLQANFFSSAAPTVELTRYQHTNGQLGFVAQELTVPAATTLVQLSAIFQPDTTASQTVRVGEFGVYNLTALGALA